MSTKPCPQCGTAVPLQARFCGQCGCTFPEPGARALPITVDEATADPPAVQPAAATAPAVPRLGMQTVIGHAAVQPAKPAPIPPSNAAPPAAFEKPAALTAMGYAAPIAAAPPPANGGANMNKTLFDPAPFGVDKEAASAAPATSQRPTPLVPPPVETEAMGKTMADPEMAERARQIRDQALADAGITPAPAAVGQLANPPVAKTMMLGGLTADDVLAAAAARNAAPPAEARPETRSAPAPAFPSDKQTMLGMPATGLAQAAPQPQPLPPAQKTMLGVALPGIAPTHDKPAPQPARMERAGTLLGVAAPGIAPLHAGAARQGSQPAFAQPVAPPPPILPAPAPLVDEPLPERPVVPVKKGVPAVVVVGIVFALVAIIGSAAAFVVMRSGAPLSAQPQLDESGKESLKIRCGSCPDGTVVSLGASSSKFEAFVTQLPLPAPLSIGDNDLEMKIDRPPPGRDETVKVHVPVAYRVKADLSTLTAAPPTVTVRVEAVPNTEVTVDGKPVALDATGKGTYALDVTSDVEGPSDESKTIDKKIPFTVKPKGAAAPEAGQLVVRTGIAPLHLDAPGMELFTDRTTGNVAGQVKPGGTVTIDSQNVAVDAQGHFGVRVELPSEGDKTITVVANAPPLAPRTVRAKLVRVGSLETATKALDARSPLGFDAYGVDPKSKIGQLALVDGDIERISVSQGHTVMVIVDKKCSGSAPCVVRVAHGEEVRAAAGDAVRAYGRIVGTASSSGKTIPDIEGSLVVTTPAKKR